MKTASFVAILLAIKVFMADLCIWQASGLAGIHNASLYISLRNGERNHFEENTKFQLGPLSRQLSRQSGKSNSKQIAEVYSFSLSLSGRAPLFIFSPLPIDFHSVFRDRSRRGQVLQKLR